jgi:NodT family efflux transporter outer membrane factor (OMF) lipoprotein
MPYPTRRTRRAVGTSLATLCLAVLGACTMVGPDYKQPPTRFDDHWLDNGSGQPIDTAQAAQWWTAFDDATLNNLVQRGYQNNLSLQIAGARVLQARAILAQSIGELYPQQQGINGAYTYTRSSGATGILAELDPSHTTASLGFSLAWELDFWGKYRRAIQANDANFKASIAAYDDALVTLISDIAGSYVQIRTLQAQIAVAQANVKVQQESLRIANARYNAGQTSMLDVQQALTQLNETLATEPQLQAQLRQQKDALAVLLGDTPGSVDGLLGGDGRIPGVPATLTAPIPKDVLRQRPDVRQAELQALAQSAAIGVAKAQLFPSLSLLGSFGFASINTGNNNIGDLFQWNSRAISLGPSLSIPLFNYGQLTNQVRAQDAAFQQSILNYQNVVLSAQQEVQDNLAGYTHGKQAVDALTKANTSATESTRLAMIRYQAGESDYTPVLNAEQAQLRVQNSLVLAQGGLPQSVIGLYRALGGGWQIRGNNDVVPDSMKQEMGKRTDWGSLLDAADPAPGELPSAQDPQKLIRAPQW